MVKGQAELGKGQATEAVQTYQKVVKTTPKYAPARFQLARAHVQAGQVEQAKSELREAINANPSFADAVFLLAELNIQAGATDPALEDLNTFIAKFPKVPRAWDLLGNAYLRKKEPAKATEASARSGDRPKDPRGLCLVGSGLRAEGRTPRRASCSRRSSPSPRRWIRWAARVHGPGGQEAGRRLAEGQAADREGLHVGGLYFVLGGVYMARGLDQAVAAPEGGGAGPRAFGSHKELGQLLQPPEQVRRRIAGAGKAAEIAPKDAGVAPSGDGVAAEGDFRAGAAELKPPWRSSPDPRWPPTTWPGSTRARTGTWRRR
jgi:tetratricopeptide (TPR) repeat protein